MKKFLLCAAFVLLLAMPALAKKEDTKLVHHSPKTFMQVSGSSVAFEWNIHSWDTIKEVILQIHAKQVDDRGLPIKAYKTKKVFSGNEGKKVSITIFDLPPKTKFAWSLTVVTENWRDSFAPNLQEHLMREGFLYNLEGLAMSFFETK